MKPLTTCTGILVVCLLSAHLAWAGPVLIPEPPLESRLDWDVAVNGMLFVSYDLDRNNRADLIVLRTVITSYYSSQSVHDIRLNHSTNLVFYVDYSSDRFYYIVTTKPLFYALDINQDGVWDIIYKDVALDGINGNEEFYDSPSGMFDDRFN